MKKLLPALLICLCTSAFGQDTTWTKTDAKLYGTKAEKVHQETIERQSWHHFLCRFIGFKQYYINDLTSYLQLQREYAVDDNAPDKPGYDIYVLSKKGVYIGNVKIPKMILTFAVNKEGRITSGRISGSFADMADLFLNYWPQDATYSSAVQLKPGVAAIKHAYGDLIAFTWVNNKPVITIKRDPDITLPVPPLTASN
jgi:hypothetical protein